MDTIVSMTMVRLIVIAQEEPKFDFWEKKPQSFATPYRSMFSVVFLMYDMPSKLSTSYDRAHSIQA